MTVFRSGSNKPINPPGRFHAGGEERVGSFAGGEDGRQQRPRYYIDRIFSSFIKRILTKKNGCNIIISSFVPVCAGWRFMACCPGLREGTLQDGRRMMLGSFYLQENTIPDIAAGGSGFSSKSQIVQQQVCSAGRCNQDLEGQDQSHHVSSRYKKIDRRSDLEGSFF